MALNILAPMQLMQGAGGMPQIPMPQVPGMPQQPMAMPPQPVMPPPTPAPAAQGFFGNLLQKLNDPNVRQALTTTGLNLMRSPGYGQSGWDVGANALQAGIGTLEQLRERDRQRGLETQDRATKEEQRKIDNTRADRQVGAVEKNADTNAKNVEGDQAAKKVDQERADKALEEAIRHNKSEEEIARLRANADQIRANAYGASTGRNPADIQKLDRLKKFYMEKQGMDEIDADKAAFDYLQTSKGKSPRQLVIDGITKKAEMWRESQFDPNAQPTPQQIEQWKQQTIAEVKFAEEAGADVSNSRGTIQRPTTPTGTTPPKTTAPAVSPAPATPVPAAAAPSGGKSPATERSIEAWKLKGATPEQIKILISTGGENPATYGY